VGGQQEQRKKRVKETRAGYRPRTRPVPHLKPTTGDAPPDSRDMEVGWVEEHRAELQQRYAGQWIVVDGDTLVAHHRILREAVDRAEDRGIRCPFVLFIRTRKYQEAYEIA
jgi:hypothetical protein